MDGEIQIGEMARKTLIALRSRGEMASADLDNDGRRFSATARFHALPTGPGRQSGNSQRKLQHEGSIEAQLK